MREREKRLEDVLVGGNNAATSGKRRKTSDYDARGSRLFALRFMTML